MRCAGCLLILLGVAVADEPKGPPPRVVVVTGFDVVKGLLTYREYRSEPRTEEQDVRVTTGHDVSIVKQRVTVYQAVPFDVSASLAGYTWQTAAGTPVTVERAAALLRDRPLAALCSEGPPDPAYLKLLDKATLVLVAKKGGR